MLGKIREEIYSTVGKAAPLEDAACELCGQPFKAVSDKGAANLTYGGAWLLSFFGLFFVLNQGTVATIFLVALMLYILVATHAVQMNIDRSCGITRKHGKTLREKV